MDESHTKYDLMIHNNKPVEKPSNKINSSSGIELIDENNSNTDSKSRLPTRKQRLKEYLTTNHTPDKNITSTYKLHNFSTVNLINFVPKIDDYNKPVKVKSQWTRTSQMELALENSINKNALSVTNLSKSEKINEIFTMDISPANGIINQTDEHTNDTRKTNKKSDPNLNYESHCVVVHKFDDNTVQVKRKRGRPKKKPYNITDNTSIISNTGNQDPVNINSADVEPKTTDEPKVIKRGRGRPRKNETTSTNIQISPIVSNSAPAKKRTRTKKDSAVVQKQRAKRLKSNKFENEDTNDSESQNLSLSKAIKSSTKKLNKHFSSSDTTEVNENSPESDEKSFPPIMLFPGEGNDFKCISLPLFNETKKSALMSLEKCHKLIHQENTNHVHFLEECEKLNEQENTKSINLLEECEKINEQENTKSVNFSEECNNLNVQKITTSVSFIKECDNFNLQENTTPINFFKKCNESIVQENTTSVSFIEGCDNSNLQENTTPINFFKKCNESIVLENTTSVSVLEECDNSNIKGNTSPINFLKECGKSNVQNKIDCISDTRIKINKFLSESEQDELEKVDWNLATKRVRSNSVNESTKIKKRRNSLTENFVYNPSKKSRKMFDDLKLMKSWKSISYIERGPNIEIERIIKDELVKKFRSKLKRSRSFPNCLFLDTVIWRFLVQESDYDGESEQSDKLQSDLDSDSNCGSERCEISELIQQYEEPEEKTNYMSENVCNSDDHRDSDRCDFRYLENNVPIQQYEQPKEKTDYMFESLDDLNMFCSINDMPSFQIPPNISDLKNSVSDQEESEGKIRRSKRLNTKVKDSDMLEEEYFLSSKNSKIDSLLLADEIRRDNEIHLAEARTNDPELDKKLKKLNFTLITNNLFRPHR